MPKAQLQDIVLLSTYIKYVNVFVVYLAWNKSILNIFKNISIFH